MQIDKHATLDVDGQSIFLPSLQGSGTIRSSGGFAGITIVDGNFSGAITGPLVIDTLHALTLSGKGSFTSFSIEGGATGTISGRASESLAMDGDPNATLVLASSAKFTGAIDGFGSGDAVDLKAIAFTGAIETYDSSTGRLSEDADSKPFISFWRACAIPDGSPHDTFRGRERRANEIGGLFQAICRAVAGEATITLGADIAAARSDPGGHAEAYQRLHRIEDGLERGATDLR